MPPNINRSEEHTSELQSRGHLVCRLLLKIICYILYLPYFPTRRSSDLFIERWFRTIKQKHIYLNPAGNGLELYQGIDRFIKKYNQRRHQGIDRRKPIDLYLNAA